MTSFSPATARGAGTALPAVRTGKLRRAERRGVTSV